MKQRRGLFGFIVVLATILVFSSLLFPVSKTSAQTEDEGRNATMRWINRATIEVTAGPTKLIFVDNDIGDRTNQFLVQDYPCTGGNAGDIEFGTMEPKDINVGRANLDLDIILGGTVGTNCVDLGNGVDKNVSNIAASRIIYAYTGQDTIGRVDGWESWNFTRSEQYDELFLRDSESGDACQDVILVEGANFRLYELDRNGGDPAPASLRQPGCFIMNDWSVDHPGNSLLMDMGASYPLGTIADNSPVGPGNPGGGGGTGEEDNSCESNSGVLGWIMCPIGGLLDEITGWLDSQIQRMLTIKEDYFTGEGGAALKDAWGQFRNIAYIILIPIMLVMVIGTALGFEVFSAYTIKRALPRLVIAVIFITMSWYVCLFLVNFFNIVGAGAKGLVTAPFQNVVQTRYDDVEVSGPQSTLKAALTAANITRPETSGNEVQSATSGLTLGLLGAGGGLVGFATGAVTVGIIASTLLTAAIVLGVVFLLLMVRQMLIIAFILLAPLAILAWIFPSNDKMWKLWWNSFSKLLILYPLIMLVVGIGQVFALITGMATGDGNDGGFENARIVSAIIIILAYIAPYFFIPFAFKWAGGVFGTIAGMANDRERGVLDRLRKGRGEKRAEGWQGFKSGTGQGMFQKNRIARNIGTRVGVGAKGRFGMGERGRQSLDQLNRQASIENVMKSPAWNAINQNDDALMAATYRNSSAAMEGLMRQGVTEENARRAVAAVQSSIGFGRAQAIASAQQLVSTGTGYNGYTDANGRRVSGLQQMTETLARASGGNASTASSLAGFSNAETKRTGRGDLAPGFVNLNRLVQNSVSGQGVTDVDYRNATKVAWGSLPLSQLVGGKEHQTQAFADYHLDRLENGNTVEKRDAAIALMEMQNSLPYSNGGNQKIINRTLNRAGVDTTGQSSMSVEDQLAVIANQPNARGISAKDMDGRNLTGGAIRGYARVYDERMGNAQTQQGIQIPPGGSGGGQIT